MVVRSVEALRLAERAAYTPEAEGDGAEVKHVLGWSGPGDGGGGLYYWDARCELNDDGGLTVRPSTGGTGRWRRLRGDHTVNVRWFGAKGDGQTDDADALQRAIDALQPGERLLVPPGEYAVSRSLLLSVMDSVWEGQGAIVPHGDFSGYLLRIVRGDRSSFGPGSDIYQLRLRVDNLKLRGRDRSRGLYIAHADQCTFANIDIEGTRGTALRLHSVRHSTFVRTKISRCRGEGEAILDLFERTDKPCPHGGSWQAAYGCFDSNVYVTFFNLSIEICEAQTYVDIGVDDPDSPYVSQNVRDIHFYSSVFHGLIRDYVEPHYEGTHRMNLGMRAVPWNVYGYSVPDDIRLIRIRNASWTKFCECHFTFASTNGALLELGEPGRPAVATLLSGCGFGIGSRYMNEKKAENNRIVEAVCVRGAEAVHCSWPNTDASSLVAGQDKEWVAIRP